MNELSKHDQGSVTGGAVKQPTGGIRALRATRVRAGYLGLASVAFLLSLVAKDPLFVATSGFVLGAAVLSAFIATWREARSPNRPG